jgi:hypothetical protein
MAPNIALDYGKIDATAAKLKSAKENLIPQLETLRTEVNGLLDDGLVFQDSSPALRESYEKFNTSLRQAVDGIGSFADTFTSIKDGMQQNDSAMAKDIREKMSQSG